MAYFRVLPYYNLQEAFILKHLWNIYLPKESHSERKKNLTVCLFKDDEISYVCHSRKSKEEIQNIRE
jgi:hypothetical protein